MRLAYLASEPHYADHLLPVQRLSGGDWHGRRAGLRRLVALGVDADHRPPPPDALTVVASSSDLARTSGPAVMVNHGAGQTYPGDPRSAANPSYTGGDGRERVVLNVCPGPADAAACREAQPDVPAVAVGSPRLDALHGTGRGDAVVFAFHSDLHLVPETRWAFPAYEDALAAFCADAPMPVVGHGHPRVWRLLDRFWRRVGAEPVAEWDRAVRRAALWVCDNSSTMYEAAALGVPVLALNAPWYRRDVEHGLRFWSHVPGLQVDAPDDLPAMVEAALADPPEAVRLRERAVARVYGSYVDGHAAERAAAAIEEASCR